MKNFNHHYELIAKVIEYLRSSQDAHPSLDEISNHVHISKFHLQRVFKEWVGISPKEFLQYITVEKSKALLQQGKTTLETSYNVGLSGNGRLHDLFLKFESCSPGEFKNGGAGMHISWDIITTQFGNTLIAETSKGICKVWFLEDAQLASDELKRDYPNAVLKQGLLRNGKKLEKYFYTWEVPHSKISIHFKGTPFQLQVWRALVKIPSGQLVAYQTIGEKIGNPKAVRAIGTAIGKNPIAYLIPCHRVIKNNGEMGNYRWHPERKVIINAFEQIRLVERLRN